ncbi:hypothetical protein [Glaciecola petra]|uniref:Uncharacterized protein n=1 Tax=Glaciecola petra TaxID=3075602 RepID=A0ABU2ZVJ9_9ALTE|nr:hypothetical protein [Aestuariibacter sp. P117]MDT0596635.1 hypothetical protein [Aestuariibacter sp. P117]
MKGVDKFVENTIKRDAYRAVWVIVFINLSALLFYMLDTELNEFAFVAIFGQLFILVVWLLPVYFYQVLVKKLDTKVAIYHALASYKNLMGQVSW